MHHFINYCHCYERADRMVSSTVSNLRYNASTPLLPTPRGSGFRTSATNFAVSVLSAAGHDTLPAMSSLNSPADIEIRRPACRG